MTAFLGGICFFLGLQLLYTWILVPKDTSCLHILIASKDCRNLEQLLRWCKGCICWGLWLGKGELLVVDRDVSEEQKEIIHCFQEKYNYISSCHITQLEEILATKVYDQVRIVCNGQFMLIG